MPARRDRLEKLYDETLNELRRRIRSKDASAADLNVARQLLRDAGIQEDPENPSKPTSALLEALREHDEEEAQVH